MQLLVLLHSYYTQYNEGKDQRKHYPLLEDVVQCTVVGHMIESGHTSCAVMGHMIESSHTSCAGHNIIHQHKLTKLTSLGLAHWHTLTLISCA